MGRVTSDVDRGISVTDFTTVGHIAKVESPKKQKMGELSFLFNNVVTMILGSK